MSPRQSIRGCLLLVVLCFLLLVFHGLKKLVVSETTNPWFLLLFLVAAMLGLVFYRVGMSYARRHFALSAEVVLEDDSRPPIVVLRSFEADNRFNLRQHSLITSLFACDAVVPLEHALVNEAGDYGPVIAIGRPKESLPPKGGARYYVPGDENWQDIVESYVEAAQLIVIILGPTEGLFWELEKIAEKGLLHKVVFVVPPARGAKLQEILHQFQRFTTTANLTVTDRIDHTVALFVPQPGQAHHLTPIYAKRLRQSVFVPKASHYLNPLAEVLDRSRTHSHSQWPELNLADPVSASFTATWFRRWCAFFIDAGISFYGVATLFMIIAIGLWARHSPEAFLASDDEEGLEIVAVGAAAGFLGIFVFTAVNDGIFTNSLGKRLTGLRIVSVGGTRLSRRAALLRTLIKLLCMMSCCFPFLALFFTDGTRSLHDMAANSMVVRVRRRKR